MELNYLESDFGDVLNKILKSKSRKTQLKLLELVSLEGQYDIDYSDDLVDYKEELKKKINNIKKIYDDAEGRELPGERYTYYETITYAKLHQLLDELLEE